MSLFVKVAVVVAAAAAAVDYAFPYVAYKEPGVKNVYTRVVEDPKGWANEGYLIPHEPLRRDIAVVAEVAARWERGETVEGFLEWFEACFKPQLAAHAVSEDGFFFKFFEEKGAALNKGRDLEADHLEIERIMSLKGDDLMASLPSLAEMLPPHFDREEEEFVPILHSISQDEWKQAVKTSHATYTNEQKMIVLPYIMHYMGAWAGPDRRDEMDAALPLPLRHVLHRFWLPKFYRTHLSFTEQFGV